MIIEANECYHMETGNPTHIQSILSSISQGDKESFETLFRIYYSKLLNFSNIYLKDEATAEDIVTEVFAKIWLRREELTKIKDADVYFFTMAKNASLNYLRNNSKMKVICIDDIHEKILADERMVFNPENEIDSKELYNTMRTAIENLPGQCRKIFKLVKQDGLTCKKVAEILDVSPRTVETQVYIAVKKLQKVLEKYILTNKPFSKNRSVKS